MCKVSEWLKEEALKRRGIRPLIDRIARGTVDRRNIFFGGYDWKIFGEQAESLNLVKIVIGPFNHVQTYTTQMHLYL